MCCAFLCSMHLYVYWGFENLHMFRIGVKFVYREGVQSVDFWCQSGVR
jgi:hypothetical protein